MASTRAVAIIGIFLAAVVTPGCKDGPVTSPARPVTVTAVSPASGPPAGGTSVTITGTNFTNVTSVTIGGSELGSRSVVSTTQITGMTPAATSAGAKDVVVTSSSNGSGTCSGCFSYVSGPPVIVDPPTALPLADSLGAILGEWRYASAPPPAAPEQPSLNTGLRVTIVIDSLDAMQFRGRVALWFAGDVGARPDAFGPVTGTLDDAGAVTVRIPLTAPGAPAITIIGTVAGDVLTIGESLLGASPGPFPAGACFERSPS